VNRAAALRGALGCWLLGVALLVACASGTTIGPHPAPTATTASTTIATGTAPTPSPASTPAPTATATPTGATPAPTGATPAPTASGATPTPTPTAPSGTATCLPGSNPTVGPETRSPVALGTYNVNPAKVFVAGISSGAFFAVQMHVAHSARFKGAAIYAGGVYYCAQNSLALALVDCGGETGITCQALYESTLSQSEAYLDAQSAAGTIDPESNLSGQPVYLWSGTKDQVVNPHEMADLDSEYEHYGANVTTDFTFPANHGWESPDGTVPCPTATEPYMIVCDQGSQPYDSPKTWLTRFFGALNPRNDGKLNGALINFDQTAFGASASNSMDTNGWIFVPQSCAGGTSCGFVLALHGCIQNQGIIGDDFVTEAGLDEWADTNNFIVMYPYAVAADDPVNPMGCWDWWGYDDSSYALKSGTQMTILYKMVQRASGLP
jgi:poly(3-hydroxybutyrate) depolymerase